MKIKSMALFLMIITLASCANWEHSTSAYSGRDITETEKIEIAQWNGNWPERAPAGWIRSCIEAIKNFFMSEAPAQTDVASDVLPELTQLNPVIKKFPNGKKYIEYTANPAVMQKYPDYDDFLQQTAEIIFEPGGPFGHINLRVGKKLYSFNNVKWTSISSFAPQMLRSDKPDMMSSHGFVFQLGKDKIAALKKDIELFYNSSQSHNIPAFDAYSPLLKIEEREATFGGKKLFYVTDSPKFGNDREISGKLAELDGQMVLDAGNGIVVPVIKKGKDYYTQSYSCSSSAAHVLEKFFGLKMSYAFSAKSLAESLSKGNIRESISPTAVIKYYED